MEKSEITAFNRRGKCYVYLRSKKTKRFIKGIEVKNTVDIAMITVLYILERAYKPERQ